MVAKPVRQAVQPPEQPHRPGRILALNEADQAAAIGARNEDGVDAKAGAG